MAAIPDYDDRRGGFAYGSRGAALRLCAIVISFVPPFILLSIALVQSTKGEGWSCGQPLASFVVASSVVYTTAMLSIWIGFLADEARWKCKCSFTIPLFLIASALIVWGAILWSRADAYKMPTDMCKVDLPPITCFPCKSSYVIETENLTMRIFLAAFWLLVWFPLVCLLFGLFFGAYDRCTNTKIPSDGCDDIRCHRQASSCWCWHKCRHGVVDEFRICGCLCPRTQNFAWEERGDVYSQIILPQVEGQNDLRQPAPGYAQIEGSQ